MIKMTRMIQTLMKMNKLMMTKVLQRRPKETTDNNGTSKVDTNSKEVKEEVIEEDSEVETEEEIGGSEEVIGGSEEAIGGSEEAIGGSEEAIVEEVEEDSMGVIVMGMTSMEDSTEVEATEEEAEEVAEVVAEVVSMEETEEEAEEVAMGAAVEASTEAVGEVAEVDLVTDSLHSLYNNKIHSIYFAITGSFSGFLP
jgi:hypothetical protein